MRAPTLTTHPCNACSATSLIMVARANTAPGWRGYFCPPCLAAWLENMPSHYLSARITITNSED